MRSISIVLGLIFLVGGCSSYVEPQPKQQAAAADMFAPVAMRIHPIFTQIKDWSAKGSPDGIEALIEFQDQFGDPTKATGRVLFELYEYRANEPDPRGRRLVNPWIGSLENIQQQHARWNRTSRTYSFQLAYDQVRTDRNYVLTATVDLTNGTRFFDRVVIEPPTVQPR